ncbi:MAG: hypothetical protein HY288_20640 [Planctomycetia bacterium]|nr:hypothetical protein [Planctomycetia bacterium]
MQCPHCQSPIEPAASTGGQIICKSCGATISPQVDPATALAARRSRGWLSTILLSLLFLVLATISVASTIVAKRTLDERDRAREDLLQASAAIDQTVATAATSTQLKGASAEPARKEFLEPALAFYQKYTQAHVGDKKALVQMAGAYFHMAAIHAKLGSKESVSSLKQGMDCITQLAKEPNADPASFPSVQASVFKLVTQGDWLAVKGVPRNEMQAYGLGFLLTLQGATSTFEQMAKAHPEVVSFRDDVAALQRVTATLESLIGLNQQSLAAWLGARDVLETLVRDRPADADYKTRLAESLVAAARLQKSAKQLDEAAANYKRAVEVREQLVAANPDDKSLQQELTVIKRDLDKLKPAQASNDPPAAAEPAAAQ